ncbi:hypothetical protein KPH14_007551 [Odynerus spinipes]|uniref:Uncharacterized protein n=1 Tax=Odynerus spinipes TaxID=1348599 RepID=A0AAD9RHQ6_9HYME|nr:hypothetical protein KPH14_007551 [Odynerus spinipes]
MKQSVDMIPSRVPRKYVYVGEYKKRLYECKTLVLWQGFSKVSRNNDNAEQMGGTSKRGQKENTTKGDEDEDEDDCGTMVELRRLETIAENIFGREK